VGGWGTDFDFVVVDTGAWRIPGAVELEYIETIVGGSVGVDSVIENGALSSLSPKEEGAGVLCIKGDDPVTPKSLKRSFSAMSVTAGVFLVAVFALALVGEATCHKKLDNGGAESSIIISL
jgi:hypothetical protein